MNSTAEYYNISSIAHAVAKQISIFAGAVSVALGLVLFLIWFGWSLNSYVSDIRSPSGVQQSETVSGAITAVVYPEEV